MPWDYIIVGAGSAGCALAHTLVAGGGNPSILIVEAGGSDRSPFIKIPAGAIRAGRDNDWGYQSRPDPSRNGASEAWTRGKVLGGSSSINGMVHVRGAASDFDRWAAELQGYNGPGWSADDVMPLFKDYEHSDQAGEARGHEGPLRVRTVRHPHPVTAAFVQSAEACGYVRNDDYNDADQEGVAYTQVAQRNGLRCSSADAFLRPVLKQPGVKLLLNTTVDQIEFDDRRAVAVRLRQYGKSRREEGRNIILCAGAINSPKILMLSGIGDAEELKKHGIDVTVDSKDVGLNLLEHPNVYLSYRTNVQTNSLSGGILQKLRFAAQFALTREGPISNLFEGVAFLKSSAAATAPDIQVLFTPIGFSPATGGLITVVSEPSVSICLNASHPKSSGRIRLASSRPDDAPLIECQLLDAQEDVDTLVRGIEVVRRVMNSDPIASMVIDEISPGPSVIGTAALEKFVRENTGVSYHPAGTCRMGTDANAVVGPDLRVNGTDNLWVADASIMPDLISGNTNAVCMMIGVKLGKSLVADRIYAS